MSEFICWITADASDKCQDEKRKTINGEDIITSMNTLGFDDYIGPLKVYLAKYRASVKGNKNPDTNATGGEREKGESNAPPSEPMSISYLGGGGSGSGCGGAGSAPSDMEEEF